MLTNIKIKNLKPKNKEYSVADSNGLSIYITSNGVKKWRFRYRFLNKASMIALGKYPAVSLYDARKLRDKYQESLAKGVNPSVYKKQQRIEMQEKVTFNQAFYTWFDRHKDEWSERTSKKNVRAFEKHIFPYIGNTPVEDIKPLDMLNIFRVMDDNNIPEVLKKVKGWSSRVFKDCVVSQLIQYDPIASLSNDSFKKYRPKNYATITSPNEIAGLLKTMSMYKDRGTYQVAEALNLSPYLMLRPGEVASLTWNEVDFKSKIIRKEASGMKMRKAHLVPMSKQVYKTLKEIKKLGLSQTYVFPSPVKSNSSICTESIRAALRTLGIKKEAFTAHGFRSMASTLLNELGFNSDWIEKQLAHNDSNRVRAAYNHADYLTERTDMMQKWADYLDELRDS
jgi:integrase